MTVISSVRLLRTPERLRHFIISLICALLLASCATPGAQRERDISALEQRVTAFWQARQAGDVISAYEFEEVKATGEVTLQQYVRRGGGLIYHNVDVENVEIVDDSKAVAALKMEYSIPALPKRINTEVKDNWVKIDGKWYHAKPVDRRL